MLPCCREQRQSRASYHERGFISGPTPGTSRSQGHSWQGPSLYAGPGTQQQSLFKDKGLVSSRGRWVPATASTAGHLGLGVDGYRALDDFGSFSNYVPGMQDITGPISPGVVSGAIYGMGDNSLGFDHVQSFPNFLPGMRQTCAICLLPAQMHEVHR